MDSPYLTKGTKWAPHTEAQAQAQAQAVGWQEAVSPDVHRYYYNPGTGQPQWERPQEQMGMYMDEDDSAV